MRPRSGMTVTAMAMLLPVGAGAAQGVAPPPKATLPADFLEYLAQLEGSQENWTDFETAEEPPPRKPTPTADAAKVEP